MTLVLTDVEGSTELWEWNPDAMMEAQKLHDAILRSRLRHFHGCGPGLCAARPIPASAAASVVVAGRQAQLEVWRSVLYRPLVW